MAEAPGVVPDGHLLRGGPAGLANVERLRRRRQPELSGGRERPRSQHAADHRRAQLARAVEALSAFQARAEHDLARKQAMTSAHPRLVIHDRRTTAADLHFAHDT
jgi:hypothetical protein